MKFNNLLFLFGVCILWSACNIINPPEKVPTYIHIDSFKFVNTDAGRTGSSSHNINSVWVTYNGTVVGVYDLPATIPIIATGSAPLSLGPGIAVNGMYSFQSIYPFYVNDTSTLVANPGKIINYTPVTTYYGPLADTFRFMENFEAGNIFVSDTTFKKITIVRTSSPDSVFEGHYSGAMRLNSVNDSAEVHERDSILIPGGPSMCEFNYKGTGDIYFGMQAFIIANGVLVASGIQYLYVFNPSDTWQKMYISLADYAAQYAGGYFHFYFKAAVHPGQSNGYILIDNVKIITSK